MCSLPILKKQKIQSETLRTRKKDTILKLFFTGNPKSNFCMQKSQSHLALKQEELCKVMINVSTSFISDSVRSDLIEYVYYKSPAEG